MTCGQFGGLGRQARTGPIPSGVQKTKTTAVLSFIRSFPPCALAQDAPRLFNQSFLGHNACTGGWPLGGALSPEPAPGLGLSPRDQREQFGS